MNLKALKAQIHELVLNNAFDYANLKQLIEDAFAEFESQPLAVVVPKLEWGEWQGGRDTRYRESACGKYRVFGCEGNGPFRAVVVDKFWGHSEPLPTEIEAIQHCQAHKEAQITKHLEGCNVVVWRDPQPLKDALRVIRHRPTQGGFAEHIVNSMQATADKALTAWEAGR